MRRALLFATLLLAALAVACSDDNAPPTATPSVSPSPTPTSAVEPPTTASPEVTSFAWPKDKRTGNRDVDALVEALQSGEHAKVQALLKLVDVPCELQQPFEAPPDAPTCAPSDAAGTPVTAFPIAACDPQWARGDGWPMVDSLLMRKPSLYAVYRQAARAPAPPEYPSGGLVVVFVFTELTGPLPGGFALEMQDGKVVRADFPCGPFPKFFFDGVAESALLLKPPGGVPVPTPTASPQLTGDPAVDRYIRALVDGDWRTLASNLVLLPEPCTVAPQGVGSRPRCPEGVAEGGTVRAARLMACERLYAQDPVRDLAYDLGPRFAFPHLLYAVYRTDGATRYNFVPTGEVAIVIRDAVPLDQAGAQTWFIKDGQVVGALLGCGERAVDVVKDVPAAAFILAPPPAPPKPSPTPTPAPDSSGYPPHWRTGDPWVDMVLEAFFSANRPRLAAHFQPYPVGCSIGPSGIPAPPRCGDGQAEGTAVDVFPVLLTEGIYVPKDGLTAIADQMMANSPRLYAVYRQEPQPPARGTFPRGEYVLIFNAGGRGMEVQVSGGNVLGVWFSSGQTAADMAALAPTGNFILAPP